MKEDFCCIFCKADGKITIEKLIWGGGGEGRGGKLQWTSMLSWGIIFFNYNWQ